MVFCNKEDKKVYDVVSTVTILILIDGFLQSQISYEYQKKMQVTILILIDGFLQYNM